MHGIISNVISADVVPFLSIINVACMASNALILLMYSFFFLYQGKGRCIQNDFAMDSYFHYDKRVDIFIQNTTS